MNNPQNTNVVIANNNPTPQDRSFGLCRDCKHWKCSEPSWLATCPRDTKPEDGWVDGVCKTLFHSLTINVSYGWDGGTVDSVETDANFGCVYFEPTAE